MDGKKESDSYGTHLANARPSVLILTKKTLIIPDPDKSLLMKKKAEKQLSMPDD